MTTLAINSYDTGNKCISHNENIELKAKDKLKFELVLTSN